MWIYVLKVTHSLFGKCKISNNVTVLLDDRQWIYRNRGACPRWRSEQTLIPELCCWDNPAIHLARFLNVLHRDKWQWMPSKQSGRGRGGKKLRFTPYMLSARSVGGTASSHRMLTWCPRRTHWKDLPTLHQGYWRSWRLSLPARQLLPPAKLPLPLKLRRYSWTTRPG